MTDGGAIYHYSAGGTLLNSLSGLVADRFEDVSYSNGFVYAVDNTTIAGLQGVLKFDTSLNLLSSFLIANPATGLASDGSSVFAVEDTSLEKYSTGGALLGSAGPYMSGDHLYDAAAMGNTLYVADNASYGAQGVVYFDKGTLSPTHSFLTPRPINGLTAGGGNLFVADDGAITRYDLSGNALNSLTGYSADRFDDLTYATATPEPGTMAVMGIAALVGLARRKRQAKA